MNIKLPFSGGGRCGTWSAWALTIGIYQYESQNCHFLGGRSASCSAWVVRWSAWALRVGIYQYESQVTIFHGGRSATWSATCSAWALRVGIYQYESQIATSLGDRSGTLICLSSESRNLSVWISNCHFLGGRSGTWSARALRVGIYQYECQIQHFLGWGRSATWSAWALRVGNLSVWIWNCHFGEVD